MLIFYISFIIANAQKSETSADVLLPSFQDVGIMRQLQTACVIASPPEPFCHTASHTTYFSKCDADAAGHGDATAGACGSEVFPRSWSVASGTLPETCPGKAEKGWLQIASANNRTKELLEQAPGNKKCLTTSESPCTGENSDRVVAAYFTEWGAYGRKFSAGSVPYDKLTHLFYSFGKLESSCKVGFHDIWGSLGMKTHQNSTDGNTSIGGENQTCIKKSAWSQECEGCETAPSETCLKNGCYAGAIGGLIEAKKQHPHLKLLLSVGGWTLSQEFSPCVETIEKRKIFIDSLVESWVKPFGFDGIDYDWEYPIKGGLKGNKHNSNDHLNYVLLVKETRIALELIEKKKWLVTSAIGIHPDRIKEMNGGENGDLEPNKTYQEFCNNVDFIMAMTYDINGGTWSRITGHNAPLYKTDKVNTDSGDINIDDAIQNLLKVGCPNNKIVMGYALYGRSFGKVDFNTEKAPHRYPNETAGCGSFDVGHYEYFDLKDNYLTENGKGKGWEYVWDEKAMVPYLKNITKQEFITFDDERSIQLKVDYMNKNQLRGSMMWELSADRDHSLIDVITFGTCNYTRSGKFPASKTGYKQSPALLQQKSDDSNKTNAGNVTSGANNTDNNLNASLQSKTNNYITIQNIVINLCIF